MDNIAVIKRKNKYGFDRYYFSVERNYLSSLRKYLSNDYRAQEISKMLNESSEDRIEVDIDFIESILKSMLLQADFNSDKEFFKSQAGVFLNDYNLANDAYVELRGEVDMNEVVDDLSRESLAEQLVANAVYGDIEALEYTITCIRNLVDVGKKIYKSRDLTNAKALVLESLRYIKTPLEVSEYEKEYNRLLDESNGRLEEVEAYLKSLQQIIIEDWKKNVTDVNAYKPGDKFRFLCHSTNSDRINGEFYSNLVSCSLLTEEFTQTYREGFGFVLAPHNIVGADGSDMYVHNYTDDEESMLTSSSVPKIASMGKVLDTCRETREENIKNGIKDKIYSEIVIKGFEPIGIFCLTVGDKELNHNYIMAKKLHQQYPHLPFIEIDLTLYKDKDTLRDYRDNLIYRIESHISPQMEKKPSSYYDNYEYFWDNFLQMKQKGNYKAGDIVSLYRENSKLVNTHIDLEELFSGKYSTSAIRTVLMHNNDYSLKGILSGYITPYDLWDLSDKLYKYADSMLLEEAVPNLGNLIKMVKTLNGTDIDIQQIRSKTPITIESIIEVVQQSLDLKASHLTDEMTLLRARKETLEASYYTKQNELKKQHRSSEIINHQFTYSLAQIHFDCKKRDLSDAELEQQALEYERTRVSDSRTLKQEEHKRLSKHKIFNAFKLRKVESALRQLNAELMIAEERTKSKSSVITGLKSDLSAVKKQFLEQTGLDFDTFPVELEEATRIRDIGIEIRLESDIRNIQEELDNINIRLQSLAHNQQQIEEVSYGRKKC